MKFPCSDLQKLFRNMTELESDVKVSPPTDIVQEMKEKRVTHKMFCPEVKKRLSI